MRIPLLALILCLGSNLALAVEQANETIPQRIQHYEVKAPTTTEEAMPLIRQKVREMENYEQQGKLEAIHEDSYSLEAAIDTLRREGRKPAAAIDAFDEAVQIIHYASESGEAKKVKQALPGLKDAAEKLAAAKPASRRD